MKTTQHSGIRTMLCVALLTVMAGCAEEQRAASLPEPLAAQAPALPALVEPAEADVILLRMADFLAEIPRFSVNIQGSYDTVQSSGRKIEFGETRKVIVNRPDRLRVEVEHSDGEKHFVLYDGKEITVFNPSQNVYAQVSRPGGIDEAIMYFLKDLNMRLPLAVLLVSRLPVELERRTQAIDYVERTEIHGAPAHHLAGSTETVDYQIWIAEGARPLPLRVVLTYKNAKGQPQFRAQFSDWNLSPEVQDSQFAFTPPEGARKISFLAQLPQTPLQKKVTPEKTGGQK